MYRYWCAAAALFYGVISMTIARERYALYAVTDRVRARTAEELLAQAAAVIRGGAQIVQLREKELPFGEFLEEARQFVALCRELGAVSIINDNVEIARLTGADGVHVGQEDMAAARAREILGPGKLVGVSAHTVEEARAAYEMGADYLGTGAAFVTGTKTDAKPIERATIRAVTSSVPIPVVAIGGITRGNLPELAGLGLAGAAVASALFAQDDPEAAARALLPICRSL